MSRWNPWRQLRLSCRNLVKRPRFTLTVVLLLALGIGGNTAIFTLLDALFLHPIPVSRLDRLVALYRTTEQVGGGYGGFDYFSYPDYRDLVARNRSFSAVAVYQWLPMNLTGGDEPVRTRGVFATANYFSVLGLTPALGRFLVPQDDEPGGQPEAVLSYGAWQRLFASRRDLIGRSIKVNGHDLTVVGVAPPGFKGTDLDAAIDVWVPLELFKQLTTRGALFDDREAAVFHPFARLRPGVTLRAATADMRRVARELRTDYKKEDHDKDIRVLALLEGSVVPRERGNYETYGRTLALAASLVLVVACVNVASLLGLRKRERRRELAIRRALGATRSLLVGTLILENLLLFAFGGLASLAVARLGLSLLWSLRPPEFAPGAPSLSLSLPVLGLALAATFVLLLLFGVLPALTGTRRDLVPALKEGAGGIGRRLRVSPRSLWVVLEVALALVALIGANLLLRSLQGAKNIDLGFTPDHLVAMTIAPGDEGYGKAQALQLYRQTLERTRALPGVTAAALSENRLLRGAIGQRAIVAEGQGQAEQIHSGERPQQRVNGVSPGFFKTVGIPILKGRDFDDGDCETCKRVAIINEPLAKLAWHGEDAVGRRFHFDSPDGPEVEVIGVTRIAKVRHIHEPPTVLVYVPLTQSYAPAMTLHVRTQGDAAALILTLRREVRQLDPNLPVEADTMSHFVEGELWIEHVSTLLMGLFGLLALILAVVGVYGMTLYLVFERRREIGLRVALGATRGRVLRLILFESLAVAGAGIVLGVALAALVLAPALASQLQGVSAKDPLSYLAQALLLLLAAGLASAIPAAWAARADPSRLLRSE